MRTVFKIFLIIIFTATAFESAKSQTTSQNSKQEITVATADSMNNGNVKVTFIELGSVRCVPCQQMQPVLQSIGEKYASQVKVVFYDIWKPEGKAYAAKYNVKMIPSQVFLDENGKEFFRHTGFYPEEEIVKLLDTKQIKSDK